MAHGVFLAVYRLLSSCDMHAVERVASVVAGCSLVALKHMDSIQTRDRTHAPYIGRQTLNHWTTNEVPMPTCKIRFVFAVGLCELLTYYEY